MFPKIGVPQNGWFIMENPIKMDDLGIQLFSEKSIYIIWVCLKNWRALKISNGFLPQRSMLGNLGVSNFEMLQDFSINRCELALEFMSNPNRFSFQKKAHHFLREHPQVRATDIMRYLCTSPS